MRYLPWVIIIVGIFLWSDAEIKNIDLREDVRILRSIRAVEVININERLKEDGRYVFKRPRRGLIKKRGRGQL